MGMQRLELAENRDQRIELWLADAPGDIFLCPFPIRLRSLQSIGAFGRQRDFPRTRVIVASRDGDELSLNQRIEIAGQRGAIEKRPGSEIGNARRAVALKGAQQRK